MYKIFKITYNDGGWHSGSLPHCFYIAKSKDEVIANSKKYKEYFERHKNFEGDVWITEVSSLVSTYNFENLEDFDIEITVKEKEKTD